MAFLPRDVVVSVKVKGGHNYVPFVPPAGDAFALQPYKLVKEVAKHEDFSKHFDVPFDASEYSMFLYRSPGNEPPTDDTDAMVKVDGSRTLKEMFEDTRLGIQLGGYDKKTLFVRIKRNSDGAITLRLTSLFLRHSRRRERSQRSAARRSLVSSTRD